MCNSEQLRWRTIVFIGDCHNMSLTIVSIQRSWGSSLPLDLLRHVRSHLRTSSTSGTRSASSTGCTSSTSSGTSSTSSTSRTRLNMRSGTIAVLAVLAVLVVLLVVLAVLVSTSSTPSPPSPPLPPSVLAACVLSSTRWRFAGGRCRLVLGPGRRTGLDEPTPSGTNAAAKRMESLPSSSTYTSMLLHSARNLDCLVHDRGPL